MRKKYGHVRSTFCVILEISFLTTKDIFSKQKNPVMVVPQTGANMRNAKNYAQKCLL